MTNRNKRQTIGICYSCPDHPNGKPIDPSDKNARKTENGWVCGICAAEQMLSLFGTGAGGGHASGPPKKP
jgi:uncharacterized CHY-type Zn-finger protein